MRLAQRARRWMGYGNPTGPARLRSMAEFSSPPPPHAHRTDLKPRGFQGLRRLLQAVLPVALVVFNVPEMAQAQSTKTITLSAASTTITEGDSGKTDVVINIAFGQNTGSTGTGFEIVFVAADSTATNNTNTNTNSCTSPAPASADICYVGGNTRSLVRATTGSFTVGIRGDMDYEPNETVKLRVRGQAIINDGWTPGEITLTITNDDTRPVATQAPAKPATPTGTELSEQVTLTWTDPGDATITKWQYRQKAGSAAWGSETNIPGSLASTTEHTITGLTDGTAYQFQVRAVNDFGGAGAGLGAWSEAVTITPELIKPVLMVSATADGQAVLTWTVPDSTPAGKLITGGVELTQWNWRFRLKGEEWPANDASITPRTSDADVRTYTHDYSQEYQSFGHTFPKVPNGAMVEYQVHVVGRSVAGSVDSNTLVFGPWSNTVETTVIHTALPGLNFTPSSLTVKKGKSASYTVALTAAVAGTLSLTSSDTAKATVAPATLTFTTGNYSTAQTVTVTGVDTGSATINHAFTSTGASAPLTTAQLSVTVSDDEILRQAHEGSVHALHAQFGQSMLGVANDIIVSRTGDAVSARGNSLLIAGRQLPFGTSPPSAAALRPDREVDWKRRRVDSVLDLLADGSFNLSMAADGSSGAGGLTFWGQGGRTSFKRHTETRSADGRVTVGGLGVELPGADWLGGLAYFRTRGKGSVTTTNAAGTSIRSEEELTMNSVHPYVHWQATEAVELWGTLGYGKGRADSDLVLATNAITSRKGRVELLSALVGTRVAWRPEWSFKGEVMATEMTTKGLSATTMKSSQLQYQAVLEWSRSQSQPDGGELRPKLEAGVRYDDDDYATGLNMVLAGSVHYTDADGRWSWNVGGSVLRSRASRRYREQGVYVGVELRAGANDVGPSMSLTATRGTKAEGQQAAWAEATLDDSRSAPDASDGVDTQLEFGYGRPWGAGHLKPKVSLVLPAAGSPVYATGFDYRHRDHFSVGVALTHKPQVDRGNGIRLTGAVSW